MTYTELTRRFGICYGRGKNQNEELVSIAIDQETWATYFENLDDTEIENPHFQAKKRKA